MYFIVPRVNLVRNIGFNELATHTLERDFADLTMHRAHAMTFPLTPPTAMEPDARLNEGVFHSHYRRLEGRGNAWQKLWDRLGRWGRTKGLGKER